MKKHFFHLSLASAFFVVAAAAKADESTAPALFRQVSVSTGTVIALDEPFNPVGLAVKVTEGVYALRPGKFAGANKLLVTVSPDGRVTGMQFGYHKELPFDDVVARYRMRFGAPRSMDGPTENAGVFWENAHTRFEILRPTASVEAVSTRLIQQ